MPDWHEHDAWWKARNLELLERGRDESLSTTQRFLALFAHGREEEARLAWKLGELEQEGRQRRATEVANA